MGQFVVRTVFGYIKYLVSDNFYVLYVVNEQLHWPTVYCICQC